MSEAAINVLERAQTELSAYREDRKFVRQARGQPEPPRFQFRSFQQIVEGPEDEPDTLMRYEPETNELLLFWGGYAYPVDLDEIRTPMQLLNMVHHVGEKAWELATSERLAAFVEKVCRKKGWDLHGG